MGHPANTRQLNSFSSVDECFGDLSLTEADIPVGEQLKSVNFYPTLNPYFAAWFCRSFHVPVVLELDWPARLLACTASDTPPTF